MIMFSECFPSHFHFHSLDFAFSTHSSDSVHANFASVFCYLVECNIFSMMMMMMMGNFPFHYVSLFYKIF